MRSDVGNDREKAAALAAAGAEIAAMVRWSKAIEDVVQHRGVRRVAPEQVGERFICTDENGLHACTREQIEADKGLDLGDLVPINRAGALEDLLVELSDAHGRLRQLPWAWLRVTLRRRGAVPEQLEALDRHRDDRSLCALFVAAEIVLDIVGRPSLQWRGGTNPDGTPRC